MRRKIRQDKGERESSDGRKKYSFMAIKEGLSNKIYLTGHM